MEFGSSVRASEPGAPDAARSLDGFDFDAAHSLSADSYREVSVQVGSTPAFPNHA